LVGGVIVNFWVLIIILNSVYVLCVGVLIQFGNVQKNYLARNHQALVKLFSFMDKDSPDVPPEDIGMPSVVGIVMAGMTLLMIDMFAIAMWFRWQ